MATFKRGSEFEITIDFKQGDGDPARIFRTMSGLIDSFQALDSHLIKTFDISVEASLVLESVESGSIKAKFKDLINGIPDEHLASSDWKKLIGYFLLKSKYVVLEWMEDKNEIVDIEDVKELESMIIEIAEETDLNILPAYSAPSSEVLLSDIHSLQESLGNLTMEDSATYKFDGKTIKFNQNLNISHEIVRDVLTQQIIKSSGKRVIKVKKPDYLGRSMWSFQYDGRGIEAKIVDSIWLAKFQSRIEEIKPGDSLTVLLSEEISIGYDSEVVHRHYEIEKIYEVNKPSEQQRIDLS